MKTTFRLALGFLLFGSLNSCGGGGVSLTISGDENPSSNACTKYTVTRSSAATETLIVQPSVESGGGAVYKDDGCSTVALLNIEMAAGASTATFAYKGTSTAGAVVLKVTTISATTGEDETDTIDITTK